MIDGGFTADGRPYVEAEIILPRLGIAGRVYFLVDTGSDTTILHPYDGIDLGCPFDELVNPEEFTSAGGTHPYYMEPAIIRLDDDDATREFDLELSVAKPHPAVNDLDSLLGRDVLNRLRMDYEYPEGRLRFYP